MHLPVRQRSHGSYHCQRRGANPLSRPRIHDLRLVRGHRPGEPQLSRGGAVKTLTVAAAVVAVTILAAWVGARRDSPPPCTAGTSSVNAAGHVTTVWYPKGCRHE